MESSPSSKSALFKVYLRLRPPPPSHLHSHSTTTNTTQPERFLSVEEPLATNANNSTGVENENGNGNGSDAVPTHITLNPPNDNRRRAVEKFAFTTVFEEDKGQLDIFEGCGVRDLVEGVLGGRARGGEGRDGLLATLGVTGSGKTHTILGSKSQRGLTQLSLDVLFRSISDQILDPITHSSLHATVAASDPSEAQVMSAQMFIDSMFSDPSAGSRANSRAPTPMMVGGGAFNSPCQELFHSSSRALYPSMSRMSALVERESMNYQGQDREVVGQVPGAYPESNRSSMAPILSKRKASMLVQSPSPSKVVKDIPSYMSNTLSQTKKYVIKSPIAKSNQISQGEYHVPFTPRRNLLNRPSALPSSPDISNIFVETDPNAEYSVLISMYEVYNDRIFDLLTPALPNKGTKDFRRRPLLFKPTEQSPDRKVVAGLRKIICSNLREALMVLEAGLHERRVAGTGSNSVSSRSHGFFCVDVKKRRRGGRGLWGGSALTIVDLAGSERARDAKTQGATLQEAGKINESLMYLGQCLQMQSDLGNSTKPNLVPFRQCKLTELLFSNSFPSSSTSQSSVPTTSHRIPQRATMIVTADPHGDFNATSQILRYSALAREITVPRIPSVTSTILAASTSNNYFGARIGSGRYSPSETERETMEIAALEIARMSEEIDGLRAELIAESERRVELEARLESASEREIEIEADVREQCYTEMEERFRKEMESWKARWMMEREEVEGHVDRKIEILGRLNLETQQQLDDIDDDEDKENVHSGSGTGVDGARELEFENEKLKREVEALRREVSNKSPTKRERLPLRESRILGSAAGVERGSTGGVEREMGRLRIDDHRGEVTKLQQQDKEREKSPTKKAVRKLGTRRWVDGEEEY